MTDIHAIPEPKAHAVAMSVKSMMDGMQELIEIAHDGNGFDLVQRDIDDLELTYIALGRLLTTLKTPVLEAAE